MSYSEESLNYEKNRNLKHVVYTPREVVRTILASLVREYFRGKDKKEALKNLKIADISCGTGNFIEESLELFFRLSKLFFGEYIYFDNWLTGIDIDEEALKIAEKRVDAVLKKYGAVSNRKIFIKKDALIEDIGNDYDIIAGNPPYIGEKNNRELFENIKKTEFGAKYYEGKMDYLYFFIERGLDILKDGGTLGYITTNYWLKADSGVILRKKIKDESEFIYIKNENSSLFKLALGQHNIIFSLKKGKNGIKTKIDEENSIFKIESDKLFTKNGKISLIPLEKQIYINTISSRSSFNIGDILNVNQGIVSGCDKAFVLNNYDERFSEILKPFYKNSDIGSYSVTSKIKRWILYTGRYKEITEELKEYLTPYRDKLEKRREVVSGNINWYNLQWGRDEEIFNTEKIVGRQRSLSCSFAYDNSEFYGSADIYYMTKKNSEISLLYILGYLNSRLFYDWFYYNGKRKGLYLELYATPLKETPVIYPDSKEKIEYIENIVREQIKNFSKEREEKLNEFFRGEN
jgi:adenine-specific DNA-methyltransferase